VRAVSQAGLYPGELVAASLMHRVLSERRAAMGGFFPSTLDGVFSFESAITRSTPGMARARKWLSVRRPLGSIVDFLAATTPRAHLAGPRSGLRGRTRLHFRMGAYNGENRGL